jgi:hypothetical protein
VKVWQLFAVLVCLTAAAFAFRGTYMCPDPILVPTRMYSLAPRLNPFWGREHPGAFVL